MTQQPAATTAAGAIAADAKGAAAVQAHTISCSGNCVIFYDTIVRVFDFLLGFILKFWNFYTAADRSK